MAAPAGSTSTLESTVQFVSADGVEWLMTTSECAGLAFELAPPVHSRPSARGKRHWSGLWWSVTMGRHVAYRSWLARDHAMDLDFDQRVISYSAQPFWLHFQDGLSGRRHVPDFFARRADGTALVVDCRAAGQSGRRDPGYAAMARACELVEWDYRLVGDLDEPRASTVRWLAGYRHLRFDDNNRAAQLRSWCDAAGGSMRLGALLEHAPGDLAMPPTLFHLLWHQRLLVDLIAPLSGETAIWVPPDRPSG